MADAEEVSYELSHQYLQPDMPPTKYRELLLTGLKNIEECILKAVHEIFQSGKYKGKRVVEVGCGPTIHRLATPSKYYNEIITSDYAPKNIESVKKWVDGDPDALDWTPLLEIVAASEGYSDLISGVKGIETRIRQKVKSVVHCDMLKESIFDPEIEEVDLLVTAYEFRGSLPESGSLFLSFYKISKQCEARWPYYDVHSPRNVLFRATRQEGIQGVKRRRGIYSWHNGRGWVRSGALRYPRERFTSL